MITYVFPGQGSQQKGMGGTLFDEFKELTTKADQILGYSIRNLCLADPELTLSQTQYTQSALFVVNALSYLQKVKNTGKKSDYVAGHSLGEYNALFAAEAFDFETGLKLVKKRGELMSRATGGGLAAVIGLNEVEIESVLKNNGLSGIDIANYNSSLQIVIAGPRADIERAKSIFEANSKVKMYLPLKVSGAFHSRYMKDVQAEFSSFLDTVSFSSLTIPVISNVYARPYKQTNIKQNLIAQITNSVKWTESIRYLMGVGVTEFEEIGPGKVLTGLIQRIQKELEPLIVPDDTITIPEKKQSSAPIEKTGEIKSWNKAIMIQLPTIPSVQKSKTGLSDTKISLFAKHIPIIFHDIQKRIDHFIAFEKSSANQPRRNRRMMPKITTQSLGSEEFKKDYNLKYAYLTGGMYRGVASQEMVVKVGKMGMMGFFGSGGLEMSEVEAAILFIQNELKEGQAYGMNLVHNPIAPEIEEKTIDLFLKHQVRNIEAAAFLNVTPALVKYRANGLKTDSQGTVLAMNRIIAKISRPEVAAAFLSPAPERIVKEMLAANRITSEQAKLLARIPMADDLCVEADSGGHTDSGVAYTLLPAMMKLRDDLLNKYQYTKKIRIGAAGGIGTPEAAAASFIMGADFILTGSINQCTVEAGTSDAVKDLLQGINVQDTEYAPAGDMFELGAKVQVLKKGVLFPGRANKLYNLYQQYNSIAEIDPKTASQIQEKYFKRSFDQVYQEVKSFYPAAEIKKAEQNPKHKMALIFRWYFGYSTRLALNGNEEGKVDFQVHCGPALGAFNQWVKGTEFENWRNRHVDEIGKLIMEATVELLDRQFTTIYRVQ
jgi:trans-AT polyketide synthase/acyltransferase/oxidoreductase domain-containing protein